MSFIFYNLKIISLLSPNKNIFLSKLIPMKIIIELIVKNKAVILYINYNFFIIFA